MATRPSTRTSGGREAPDRPVRARCPSSSSSRPSTRRRTCRALFADLEARPALFAAGSRLIIVDDGSQDGTAGVVRGLRRAAPGRARPARAATRAPAPRSAPASTRRSRAMPGRRARRHARGRHDERPRRARRRCSSARATGADARARLGPRRRSDAQRQRAAPRAQRAAPASSSAARSGSTHARSRRSSASTARRSCGARVDALRRRPDPGARLRLQGRAAREARRARRAHRGGAGRPRLPRRASATSKMPMLPTLAGYWRLMRAQRGVAQGVGRPHEPADGRHRRRRHPRDDRRATGSLQAGVRRLALRALAATSAASSAPSTSTATHVDRFYHVVLPTDDRVRGLATRARARRAASASGPRGVGFYDDGRLVLDDLAARVPDASRCCAPHDRAAPRRRSSPAAS